MLKQRMWLCDECEDGRCITVVEDDVGEIGCVINPEDCPFKSPEEVERTGGCIADWREVEPSQYAKWVDVDEDVDVYGSTLETEIQHGMEVVEGLRRLRNSCRLVIDASVNAVSEDRCKELGEEIAKVLVNQRTHVGEDTTAVLMVLHDLLTVTLAFAEEGGDPLED